MECRRLGRAERIERDESGKIRSVDGTIILGDLEGSSDFNNISR